MKSFLVKAGAAVTAIISAGTAVVGVTTTINAESSEEINNKINQSNNQLSELESKLKSINDEINQLDSKATDLISQMNRKMLISFLTTLNNIRKNRVILQRI